MHSFSASAQKSRVFFTIFAFVALGILLTGCELSKNYLRTDRPMDYEREEYRRALAPRPTPDAAAEAPIPELSPVVDADISTRPPVPLVTISVNQTVSLREVLYEIAEQAEIDLELDPNITGSIIFTAREKPVDDVIARIADMAGLRYRFDGDFLRVEVDRPYQKTYKMRYLNGTRAVETSIDYSLSVAAESDGGGEGETGTAASITQAIDADLWAEIEGNLRTILQITDAQVLLRSLSTPSAQILAPQAQPSVNQQLGPDGTPVDPAAAQQTAAGGGTAATGQPAAATAAATPAAPGTVPGQIQVLSTPAPEDIPVQAANLTINRQAGVISVFATDKQHREVESYLNEVRKNVTTQVLIEAKVLEVSLLDQFATGINWDSVTLFNNNFGFDITAGGNFIQGVLDPPITTGTDFNVAYNSSDLNVAVDAISKFGTVRALSSPRLTTLNNNMAIINVTNNEAFFDCTVDRESETTDAGTNTTVEVDCESFTVPIGVILTVQPSVDIESNEISMNIRPVITEISNLEDNPTIPLAQLILNGAVDPDTPPNQFPEVDQKIIDSSIKVRSGGVVVMGGLMKDSNITDEEGIPVLSDIPLLGAAFKSKKDKIEKTEIVIFIKATIIPSEYADETDKDLYRSFGADRRPLRF